MYRCFKLTMDLWSFKQNDGQFLDACRKSGSDLKKDLSESFDSILKNAIDENGVIAGESFMQSWFPIDDYDVFLSYSHDDEELVYWSSFLVTLCSEIMLYIETPLVSYSYSLNEVSHSCTS